MAIFIKFNGKNFKIPNKLTIGRGGPFVSEDHSFARDHAEIIKSKNGTFAKKKNKNFKFVIEGKPILDTKFHLINPGSCFKLGETSFEVLSSAPQSYEEIKKTSSNLSTVFSMKNMGNFWSIFASICILYGEIKSPDKGQFNYIFTFFYIATVVIAIKIYFTILSKFANESKLLAKEIISTKDSLTIYFEGGDNFSFKFCDLQNWSHKGMITTIECYGKTIAIQNSSKKFFTTPNKNVVGELPNILMTYAPNKEVKSNLYALASLRLLTIFPIIHLAFSSIYNESVVTILIYVLLAIAPYFVLIVMLREDKFRRIWYFYDKNNTSYIKKQNIALGVIGVIYLFSIKNNYQNYILLPEIQKISSCSRGNEKDCINLKYDIAYYTDYYRNKKILSLANHECKLGNKIACTYFPIKNDQTTNREIANEKK